MRIILYTGKGGTGKTSLAAATALEVARRGYRTIVFSTDIAHSLADSFDMPLGHQPTYLAPNLWGQEVDVLQEIQSHWGTIQKWLSSVLSWRGLDIILAEEMAVIPGMEELSSLLYLNRYADGKDFDVIVVDCAPTGETLRLLAFPEAARWWMEKFFPIERRAATILRPVARAILKVPVPGDEVFGAVESLFHDLERMHTILTDPGRSSVRLVVNPEKMVIKEAQRTYTYLNLYGYNTDLVICNRVLPLEAQAGYFQGWRDSQARYLKLVEECFAPIPILQAPLLEQEVVGVPMLEALARETFAGQDPALFFFSGQAYRIISHKRGATLVISLPFVGKEDISLSRSGDDLIVDVGRFRRNVHLPRVLAGLEVAEARAEGEALRVEFLRLESKTRRNVGIKEEP